MKAHNDIDKLFKDGLGKPDIPFNELDWEELDKQLHPKPKRRIVPFFWLATAAGIAATLIVIFLLPDKDDRSSVPAIVKQKSKYNQKSTPVNTDSKAEKSNELPKPIVITDDKISLSAQTKKTDYKRTTKSINMLPKENLIQSIAQNNILPVLLKSSIEFEDRKSSITFSKQTINTNLALQKANNSVIKTTKTKPGFVLAIIAAPDLTGIQKSGRSSLSGGIGIEATLMLTKRLSITTGAAYAKKIYDSDFSLYNPKSNYVFKNQPLNIHANCDVLDIPLNVNYKILENNRNALILTTGLSTYLMLKEDYYYSYETPNSKWPQSYEVKNENQHYLGIANIGVTFQRKINSRLSLGITPFAKIPLTNIGYGNSRLSSTGVAVSVNMTNLFSKKENTSMPK